ncbi:MAG: anti-sigma factor family protein [Anaerolineales bacterium]|jgi:anti-sigma factor (TIGR02949 family)
MNERHNCKYLLDSLSEYIDGELNQSICDEIDRHLEECDDCRIVVNTLEKTVYLYHKTTPQQEIPVDVKKRLYKKLELEDFLGS